MRPYAERMQELMAGTAKAAGAVPPAAARAARQRARPRDRDRRRRPRPRRRVQRAGPSAVARADARGAGGRAGGQVLHRRQEGAVHDPLPRAPARRGVDGVQRQAGLQRRPGDRPQRSPTPTSARRSTGSSSSTTNTSRRSSSASPSPSCCRSRSTRSAKVRRRCPRSTRIRPTSSSSPSLGTSSSGCCRCTSRPQLYRALLESAASFFGAQMTAMRNASKAAGELIDTLTLAMNRARQAEITQEILEVVAGADALTQ